MLGGDFDADEGAGLGVAGAAVEAEGGVGPGHRGLLFAEAVAAQVALLAVGVGAFPSRRGILADFWGTGMSHGPDTEVVAELRPHAGDIQVTKWRYSAFQRTDLRELLGYYNRDQLMITGVYTHMGCMLSAAEAFMSDVRPFLALDATADFSREEHLMALNYTARRCGAVLSTADLLEQLSEVPARAG